MARGPPISDSLGPLNGLGGPSLFPRTMMASTDASFPSDHKDLDSIHHFMKSLVSKRPEMLLEEAKSIFDKGSELLSSSFAAFAASGIDDAAPRETEKLQERRPGLGRKRARFSLKPNSSQSSVSLEPSLNIDQLQDPEEFFSAVERIENARKEIEKQKGGGIPALDDNNLPQNARQRRPGLLGKSVAYKHRYSFGTFESEDTFMSSQEPFEPNVPSGPNHESLKETNDSDVELQDIDVPGSIKKTENMVKKILDELLSGNSEDLDGDGAVSLLQERLQIKPIELSTLSMPDFDDIGRTDYVSLGKNVFKPRRTSLEVQNLVNRTCKETPVNHKQVEKSPANSLASITPHKSPFASISLLKKRILQSNPLRDPFSPLNVDLSTPRDHSSFNQVDSNPDEVNGLERFNISDKLNSLTKDGISKPKVSDCGSEKVMMGDSDLADHFMDENSSRQSRYEDVMPDGSHSNLRVHHDGYNMDETSAEDTENNYLMDGSDRIKENVEDGPKQVVSSPMEHDGLKRFNISDKLNSLTKDGISKPKISDCGAEKVMMGDSDLADHFVDENSSRQSRYEDVMPDGSHSNLRVHDDGYNMDGTSAEDTENDYLMDGSDRIKENVEDGPKQVVSSPMEHDGLKRFNISDKLNSLTKDGFSKPKISDCGAEKVMMRGSDLADHFVDENSSRQSRYEDVMPDGSHSNLRVYHDGYNMDGTSAEDTENDYLMDGSGRIKENVEDGPKQVVSSPMEHDGLKRFNISDKLNSLTKDGISKPKISDCGAEKVMMGDSDLADHFVDENSSRQSRYEDIMPDGSHSNLRVHDDGYNMDERSAEDTENGYIMDGSDRIKENVEDDPKQVVPSPMEHDGADYSTTSPSAISVHGSSQMAKNAENMISAAFSAQMDINIEESMNPGISDQRFFDESHSATTEGCTMGMQSSMQESDSKEETEKLPSKNGQQKREKTVGKRERKTLSSRPSIADAGTSFETGVRKSRRIKMRPLEYWKGERFLYGRVNDSLKLIGLKYISPAKGDGKLKVKPYISDEYNELLELAAKH